MVVDIERAMLEEGGHTVHGHLLENPSAAGATLAALARAAWNRNAAAGVVAAARHFGADVVHVHNTWFALSPAVFPAVKAAGFPVVTTLHNYRLACVNALLYRDERPCLDCVGRLPWPGVVHRCYRESATQSSVVAVTIATHRLRHTWDRDVDLMIVLTRFAAEIVARSGIPEGRIVVKPNVVDDPGPRTRPPSTSDTVLYVGRLTEDKGILDLIAAWGKAKPAGIAMTVIGDGPLRDKVESAGAIGVTALGRLSPDEVRRHMLGARALVLPSRWFEGMPMVLLEAMAAGLPVLVPDHGDLTEIAGEGGIRFEPCDVGSLADALALLEDGRRVDRHGAAARAVYLDRHQPSRGVTRLLEIYERAGAGG